MMTATSAAEEKRALRAQLRERLSALSPAERAAQSLCACERLLADKAFTRALTVMVFLSLPDELDTLPIALRAFQEGKTVCAPRVDWKRTRLTPVEMAAFDERLFEVRKFGVREPASDAQPTPLEDIDLVLVPGLAFDERCYRLGRGEGYYDRFLAQPRLARARLFGLCFDFQMVAAVPTSDHDVQLDEVVTDQRTVRRPDG